MTPEAGAAASPRSSTGDLEPGRSRRWILGAILTAALLRGLFWVAVTEVPNPVDEIHHFAYVDSLATGNGIPRVGQDLLTRPMLELMRESPTFGYRRHDLDPGRPQEWGPAAFQYEAVQPPLYYLVVAPAYHAGRPWGILGSLYAVRIASVLLALTAIPLAWLLARELFGDRPLAWAFAALLPAVVQGFNANLSSVTNDALVVPLAAASVLVIVRTVRRPEWRGALWCGTVIGLAMLAKLNAAALIPILGLAIVLLPQDPGRRLWRRIWWGALSAVVAASLVSLWFGWNLLSYGSVNGASAETARLLAPLKISYPFTLDGVWNHLREARRGFWQFERLSPPGAGNYGRLFILAAAVAGAGLVLTLTRSRRRDQAVRLAWLASCWPVVFASMLAIVYIAYTSTVVGRHTYPAMIPLLGFIAAGTLVGFGRPLGPILLAVTVAAALWMEQTENQRYIDSVYLEHIFEAGLAPAWEQPFNDGPVLAQGVTVESACPVVWLGLGITDAPPAQLSVTAAGGSHTATLLGEREGIVLYRLPEPHSTDLQVRFDAPLPLGSAEGGGGQVRFSGGPSDRTPMAQIQCRTENGPESRFRQRFEPFHWDFISYRSTLGWGRIWALAGILFAVAVALMEAQRWFSIRRRGNPAEP